MLSWFKVLVIIVLLPAISTATSNKTNHTESNKPHIHLSTQDKVHNSMFTGRGMSVRQEDVEDWSMEALKYDVSQIHSLKKIYAYLNLLAGCPYGHVKLQNLTIKRAKARLDAKTEKGNYIPYLNISIGSYIQKPAIVVIAGVKGCHWLTVAAAMNLAQQLVVYYDKNYEHTSRVTWIIIPVLNPDGYDITLSDKNMRNWPKNMGKPPVPELLRRKAQNCFGVDLCLNFEYQFVDYNYQTSSWCDDNYADKPFTQNETKGVRDTIGDHLDTVKIFVTLSQFKRALMYPFRYTLVKPIFWKVYQKIVKRAAKAAYEKHHRSFEYGHVLKFKKKSVGELDDWVMAHLGVSLGFTYEVAEWISNNDTVSGREIQWINEETFAALKATAKSGAKFDEMGFLPSTDTNNCRKTYSINNFVFVAISLVQLMFLL